MFYIHLSLSLFLQKKLNRLNNSMILSQQVFLKYLADQIFYQVPWSLKKRLQNYVSALKQTSKNNHQLTTMKNLFVKLHV